MSNRGKYGDAPPRAQFEKQAAISFCPYLVFSDRCVDVTSAKKPVSVPASTKYLSLMAKSLFEIKFPAFKTPISLEVTWKRSLSCSQIIQRLAVILYTGLCSEKPLKLTYVVSHLRDGTGFSQRQVLTVTSVHHGRSPNLSTTNLIFKTRAN